MKKLLSLMLVSLLAISIFAFQDVGAATTVLDNSTIKVEESLNVDDFGGALTQTEEDGYVGSITTNSQINVFIWELSYNEYLISTEELNSTTKDLIVYEGTYTGTSQLIHSYTTNSEDVEYYYKITFKEESNFNLAIKVGNEIDSTATNNPILLNVDSSYNLDYSSKWKIEYNDQVTLGEDLEVSVTMTSGGSGIEKLYEVYFVNSASSQIDVAAGIVPSNGTHAVLDETVTFTIDTSGQTEGDYTFQISRLFVEYQGADETLYPSVDIGDLSYTIVDGPVITLTGDATMYVEYDSTFTDPGATANDAEDGDLTSSISTSGTVDTSTLGTYTITYEVQDSDSNIETVDRTVIVQDSTKPVITLSGGANIDVFVDASYTDAGATASDNYDGNITDDIVQTGTVNTAVPGTYYLYFNVNDTNGNTADTVTRQVNVVDASAPTITLTGDATMTIEVGGTFTDPGATASDETDGDLTADIVVTGIVNTNAIGTYLVHYNVQDSAGNDAVQKTRTVNIVDTTEPTFELVGDATYYVEVGTDYVEPGVTAIDDYYGDISDQVEITGTVNTSLLGTYVLSYDIEDAAGNAAATITRSVVVRDTTAPTISVHGVTTLNSSATLIGDLLSPTASDLYDGTLTGDITTTLDEYSGNETAVGTYDVTFEVSDASGNTATKTITITVIDDLAPVISGAVDFIDRETYNSMTQEDMMNYLAGTYDPGAMTGDELILINDLENPLVLADITDLLTANDAEDGDITADITVSNDGYTSNEDVLGEYLITYAVTDSGSQTTQRIVTVINVDFLSPVISYDETALTVAKDDSITLSDLQLVVIDNVDGDITNEVQITGWSAVDFTTIGAYDVQIDIVDESGNTSQAILTINVVDDVAPVITGPDAFIKHPDFIFNAQDLLDYYTAEDNIDGDITANIEMLSNELIGNADDPGTYNVVLRIEDAAGNVTLKELTVQVDASVPVYLVVDNTKIVIDSEVLFETQDFIDLLIYIEDIPEKVYVPTIDQDTYTADATVPGTYDYDLTLNSADGNEYIRTIDVEVADDTVVAGPGIIVIPDDGLITVFGQPWYYAAIALGVVAGGLYYLFGKKK